MKTRTKLLLSLVLELACWLAGQALAAPAANPGARDPRRFEALGLARQAEGDLTGALRAFTSLVDLGPRDAGMLARAGHLALRLGRADLAARYLTRAAAERPDRANYARGLALARWAAGQHADAVAPLLAALGARYPSRYGDLKRVMRGEAHAILDSWEATGLADAAQVQGLRARVGPRPGPSPALQVSMHWESEASDVDLALTDPAGETCWFRNRTTSSGLSLHADVSQGLGPEVIEVPQGRLRPGTYRVAVRGTRPGPSGVARGIVVVRRSTGDGRPSLEVVPFTLDPPSTPGTEPALHLVTALEVE